MTKAGALKRGHIQCLKRIIHLAQFATLIINHHNYRTIEAMNIDYMSKIDIEKMRHQLSRIKAQIDIFNKEYNDTVNDDIDTQICDTITYVCFFAFNSNDVCFVQEIYECWV